MKKRLRSASGANAAWLGVDRELAVPLQQQLLRAIRDGILSGRLGPGTRLPSSRDLAKQCGVSRNTVLEAYAQLTAEGYLDGRVGAGTYVSESIPDSLLRVATAPARSPRLSSQGQRLVGRSADPGSGRPGPFRVGVPAVDQFPIRLWSRLVARIWRESSSSILGYDDDAGFGPLRAAIASHVGANRGVACDPSRVIVVSGSQQALDLTARILIEPGDAVWIEDPVYGGARRTFESSGATLLPVPIDREGMKIGQIQLRPDAARIAYVTPSHQYPLGSTLSLERRLHLLDWASRQDGWIVEDDYDSDFRYTSRPLPALQGMDRSDRVIYIGTFSKVLLPSIRIGYVIAPPSLVSAYTSARVLAGRGTSVVEQAALADLIEGGHLDRHLRRMRTLYEERQQRLVEALRTQASDLLETEPSEAGMHLIAWLPENVSDEAVAKSASERGVEVQPLSAYSISRRPRGGLVLGYGAVDVGEIAPAVETLCEAVRSCFRAGT